jgi:hypothetical protein
MDGRMGDMREMVWRGKGMDRDVWRLERRQHATHDAECERDQRKASFRGTNCIRVKDSI